MAMRNLRGSRSKRTFQSSRNTALGQASRFSAFDLEQLGKQIAAPLTMESGEELEVVGWLVSNCRTDLVLTEQETRIYDEYFPGPRQITLLAKPEKLKPTRYGFLARPRGGGLLDKMCRDTFILPLSTKGEATAVRETPEETPPLVVPAASAPPRIPAREAQPLIPVTPPQTLVTPPTLVRPSTPTAPAAPALHNAAPTPAASMPRPDVPPTPVRTAPEPDPKPVLASTALASPPSRPVEPEPTEPLAPRPLAAPQRIPAASSTASAPDVRAVPLSTKTNDSPASLPVSAPAREIPSPPVNAAATSASLPGEKAEDHAGPVGERRAERVRDRRSSKSRSILMLQPEPPETESEPDEVSEPAPERQQFSKPFPWREFALAMAVIAVLAAAAIWTYLRLPPEQIPLSAEVQPGQVVVTWPPERTKNADRCSITTWINGQPGSQALSADEQSEGKAIVRTSSPDVTIQLHAPHWYRESTGQIRVFRIIPPPPTPEPVPPKVRRTEGGMPLPPLVGRPVDPATRKPPQ